MTSNHRGSEQYYEKKPKGITSKDVILFYFGLLYWNNIGSKYRGVYRSGTNRWKSQIQIEGIQYYLGVFDTEDDAAREFNKQALKFGRPEISNLILADTIEDDKNNSIKDEDDNVENINNSNNNPHLHPILHRQNHSYLGTTGNGMTTSSSSSSSSSSLTPDILDSNMERDFIAAMESTPMSERSNEKNRSKIVVTSYTDMIYPMIKLGMLCYDLQCKYKLLNGKITSLFEENSSGISDIEILITLHEEMTVLLKDMKDQTSKIISLVNEDNRLKDAILSDRLIVD